MPRILTVTAAAILGVSLAAPAFAACDAACKENRALWKTKDAVNVGGDTYYVAIAPGNAYALVVWKKGVKAFTMEKVGAAVKSVSGCRAVDTQGFTALQKAKGGEIQTRIFRKAKFLRFGMKC